jgi:hypothetical protein
VSLVDVSELMSDPEFMRAVVLRRATIHFANEGEAISSYEDTDFTASVQPAKAEDVALLPEGERGSGRIVSIYTSTALKPDMSDGKTTIADLIVVGGTRPGTFRVVGVEPWGDNGYFKALAVEIVK